MRILVTGSRNWTDTSKIKEVLNEYNNFDYPILIHGNARGADSIADNIAKQFGWAVISESAEWQKYGKAAGHIRNQKMIIAHRPNVVLAFPLGESKGTRGCIKLASDAGIMVRVFEGNILAE